jgi:hypothetical protein
LADREHDAGISSSFSTLWTEIVFEARSIVPVTAT